MSEPQTVIIPSSPSDLVEIRQFLDAGSDCLTRIAGERDAIKTIIEEVAEKFNLSKKVVRRMINIHYKMNLEELDAEQEELSLVYTAVVEAGNNS